MSSSNHEGFQTNSDTKILLGAAVFLGTTLESLVRAARHFDFAVLVLTPDDVRQRRDATEGAPRDNVVFELGLFVGALGRERTFVVHPRDESINLPTDLAGVTVVRFAAREDGNVRAALGPACTQLKDAIVRRLAASAVPPIIEGRLVDREQAYCARRRRRRSLGTARGGPCWIQRIVDLSVTGALLETSGEIVVGETLDLDLRFETGESACVVARVVRVQYPGWERIGGVGVEFIEYAESAKEAIERYVESDPQHLAA